MATNILWKRVKLVYKSLLILQNQITGRMTLQIIVTNAGYY